MIAVCSGILRVRQIWDDLVGCRVDFRASSHKVPIVLQKPLGAKLARARWQGVNRSYTASEMACRYHVLHCCSYASQPHNANGRWDVVDFFTSLTLCQTMLSAA